MVKLVKGGLLIIAAVFFVSVQAKALSLSDIRTQVRYAVDDSGESGRRAYTDSVLNGFINEAQRDVVTMTWCLEKSTSITLVAATTYYALPTDVYNVTQVLYTNAQAVVVELKETTLHKIWEENPRWQSTGGKPNQYYVEQDDTDSDQLRIGIYQPPISSSTGTLTIQYVNQATDMSSDSDVPLDGLRHLYPYHIAMAYHVAARIKLLEKKPNEAKSYFELYFSVLGQMKDRLGQMPNYHPTGRAYTPAPR